MRDKLKILLIAEAANPEWASVPLIGWSANDALRNVADVHLVTHIRNKDAILKQGLKEGVDVTIIDSEAVAKPLWKLGSLIRKDGRGWTIASAVSSLAYPYFEHLVWKRFKTRIKAKEFDIVHRITPLSPTSPSPIAKRCKAAGIPFVLGPLNGGVPWPQEFEHIRRQEQEWLSYIRSAYRLLPNRASTLRNSAAILVASLHTKSEIPANLLGKCIYLPENGVDMRKFSSSRTPSDGPLRVCFIGRMVPYKGPEILLDAMAPMLRDGRATLDMIGDGPVLSALREKSRLEGLDDAVTFHGWIAHGNVQNIGAKCDVFGFPSIREFGGGAVLEAMALGLVPLVVDYAGPAELVDDTVGYKVPMGSPDEIITYIRMQLDILEKDRSLLDAKSSAAKARVLQMFTWDQKAQQILDVYRWAITPSGPPPSFFDI